MLIPLIVTLITIIAISLSIASSEPVVEMKKASIIFGEVANSYNIEKVLKDAVEYKCVLDPGFCKGKRDAATGDIDLSFSDISDVLPSSFQNDNLLGGSYTLLKITSNDTVLRIYGSIPSDPERRIYLLHRGALAYGTKPECVIGSPDTDPTCDGDDRVYHEFSTSLELRDALSN